MKVSNYNKQLPRHATLLDIIVCLYISTNVFYAYTTPTLPYNINLKEFLKTALKSRGDPPTSIENFFFSR